MKKKEIFSLVKKMTTLYDKDFNNILKEYDLTSSQSEVLEILFQTKGELTNRDIEKKLCLSNPTVAGILKRLEAKGFVAIEKQNEDHRKHRLIPTERALEVKNAIRKEKNNLQNQYMEMLSPDELGQLYGLLNQVFDNMAG